MPETGPTGVIHPVFERFTFFAPGIDQELGYDRSGMRTRHAYEDGMTPEEHRRQREGATGAGAGQPGPYYPPLDEELFEWVDILEAVDEARGTFTMVELGAGYGRWTGRAWKAVQQRPGLEARFLAVEAEPTHFAWMIQHFRDNGVPFREEDMFRAPVAAGEGEVPFHVGEPGAWYGQAIAPGYPWRGLLGPYRRLRSRARRAGLPLFRMRGEVVHLEAVTLSRVLRGVAHVDLIDLDIQGAEAEVLLGAADLLDARVRRLHIGTHSGRIEAELRKHFLAAGWEPIHDYAGGGTRETPYGPVTFGDGVQSWRNRGR